MLKRKTDISEQKEISEEVRQSKVAPAGDDCVGSPESLHQDSGKIHIVSFHLLKNEYAFEVSDAVEVVKLRGLTSVPRTPGFIKGILSVRGDMVPVIDLKMRLGVGSSGDRAGRILITAIEDLKVGFIVDKLSGVQEIPLSSIVLSDGVEGSSTQPFVKGIISINGMTISLLNLGSLIDISGVK